MTMLALPLQGKYAINVYFDKLFTLHYVSVHITVTILALLLKGKYANNVHFDKLFTSQ